MPEPAELQRWDCYVDMIDDTHVHLVMKDATADQGNTEEIGSVPRKLMKHLDPKPGQYVTVKVMSDRRIEIEDTVSTEEEMAAAKARRDEFLSLLDKMREMALADEASIGNGRGISREGEG